MSAKELIVRPISAAMANALVKRLHYSGSVVNNSQLHLGVYWRGVLHGAMQCGPPMDRSKLIGLVEGTPWNGFMEINRMAFSDHLPRNSESRAMAVVFRLLREKRPDLQWVVSFADATQCGDGTIYRATGFVLTGMRANSTLVELPDGSRHANISLRPGTAIRKVALKMLGLHENGKQSLKMLVDAGAKLLPGYQMRYIYFLDPTARQRLTVPVIPFAEIDRAGAGMYRGKARPRAGSIDADAPARQAGEGGSQPTPALHPLV